MIRFGSALLVALVPLALAAQDTKPELFVSKDGKFSIALPGKAAESKNKAKVGDGTVDLYVFKVTHKSSAFIVTYSDYPKDKIGADKEKFVADRVEANVANLKGKVLSNEKLALGKGKHPGREARVELGEKKQLYRARVYLVGERVYQVVVLGPDEFVKGKEVDDYFASFKVDE